MFTVQVHPYIIHHFNGFETNLIYKEKRPFKNYFCGLDVFDHTN